ncbi:MAG: hypothetical protein SGBAC_009611 [Bacillariaceae sp.]
MPRRLSYITTKYDKHKSLERQASVQRSLDALGISLDDDEPLFGMKGGASTNSWPPASPQKASSPLRTDKKKAKRRRSRTDVRCEKKRKCRPRRVSSADSAELQASRAETSTPPSISEKKSITREPDTKSPKKTKKSRKREKKIEKRRRCRNATNQDDEQGTQSLPPPSPQNASRLFREKKVGKRKRSRSGAYEKKRNQCPPRRVSSADTSEELQPRVQRQTTESPSNEKSCITREPDAKSSKSTTKKSSKQGRQWWKVDDDSTTMSLSTETSESIHDAPSKPKLVTITRTPSPAGRPASKKRNSFLVPTISPLTPMGLNDSFCIEELHLPEEPNQIIRRSSSVAFSDFSEMTIVADLSDGNDDLFYKDEELAEFRHEAFLESCGLGEEFKHL